MCNKADFMEAAGSGPEVAGCRSARSHLRRSILLRGEDDRRLLLAVLCRPQGQAGKRQLLRKLRGRRAGGLPPLQAMPAKRAQFGSAAGREVAEICRGIETARQIPSLNEMASRAGMSAYHFHRLIQSCHRRDAEGLCDRPSCCAIVMSDGAISKTDFDTQR
jgi:AraC-like DNA-binding protein